MEVRKVKALMMASEVDLDIHRACYSDGKLVPSQAGQTDQPKPCAGNDGTTLTVRCPWILLRTNYGTNVPTQY